MITDNMMTVVHMP